MTLNIKSEKETRIAAKVRGLMDRIKDMEENMGDPTDLYHQLEKALEEFKEIRLNERKSGIFFVE